VRVSRTGTIPHRTGACLHAPEWQNRYIYEMSTLYEQRKSAIIKGELYFWTATIHNWKHLLASDEMKMHIIQSLQWLKQRNLISIYAYVIMPNHLHFIWQVHANNGKESPQGSLLKFTAHQFRKILLEKYPDGLKGYEVNAANKKYEFWQRDSLAQVLYNKSFISQKMDYIHNNPLTGKWQLATTADDYRFSSSSFYQTGIDPFGILTHIGEVF
jgi:putative transposase